MSFALPLLVQLKSKGPLHGGENGESNTAAGTCSRQGVKQEDWDFPVRLCAERLVALGTELLTLTHRDSSDLALE